MKGTSFRKGPRTALAAAALVGGLALLPGQPALADVSLNAGRIGAQNVPAVAKFYEDAFGLKEVNRINVPGGNVEIMLNFGDTAQAAKANPNAQVVIMHRPSDDIKDPVPHLIFNVSDLTATAAAVQAAGGMMQGKPRPFGHTGMLIGFAVDPAGNRLELIQQPRRGAGQE